jgi:hypothetical protein
MADGSVDQMRVYRDQLLAHTPAESKGKPCTEVCIFKLKPEYASDHATTLSIFESEYAPNADPSKPWSKGIRRIGWGISVDDPSSMVFTVDWDAIEYHWDFWLSEGFPPLMAAISKLFESGRPLVRHYNFGGKGTPPAELPFLRIAVWDDGDAREGNVSKSSNAALAGTDNVREGYAIDMQETTWWCSLLAFASESEALETKIQTGRDAVSHVYKVRYL